MNSSHDQKDWQMSQAPLQSPSMAENTTLPTPQPPTLQNYPPMPVGHGYGHQFQQGAPMHPPVHQYPPMTTSYMPPAKQETDPRLPGSMAHSQPNTPRPTSSVSESLPSPSPKTRPVYSTTSFHATPYPTMARKRSRNDSLFPAEAGPFFSSTKPFDNLYAPDRSTLLTLRIQSKVDRGFFLADNDWTCYRRNYFQVSSAFSVHGLNHYYADNEPQCLVQTDKGFRCVERFLLGISARVSNSDKQIELVQHTPKRDKGPQMKPEPKPITPGGNLSMSTVGTNQNIVTFERIQFKTATANNGKRRAAQQYYVCVIDLFAETDEGQTIKVASCQSAPLVVRGRSPGHYADSQDRYSSGNMGMTDSMAAPPPPPSSAQQQSHDERFNAPFPRPPITPPGMVPGEYTSPYPYYSNYPPFAPMHTPLPPNMMMSSAPPTPTPPPQHTSVSSVPTYSHPPASHPYMVHSMSDPSSSESSSPDLYTGEFASHPNLPGSAEGKMHPGQLSHPGHHPAGLNIHIPMDPATAEWTRTRFNSSGSTQSPANEHTPNSYFPNGTPTMSSAASQTSAFSPPTPTTPYGSRKYSAVPSIVNQPTA
ncbi:meiosis-specific transcription factor ndt80 [Apophysomyces sp. BC1034]|nr:meiosis-specific transcription factor ndt80 [Apophysomyces sp. BC1015]KAG0170366.1 meiosis-specific transcription factor ndt80 [Apophysomyces sp. BC1021]KAG0184635.1 meiosis-specific transcription factor ndt80 [Apophysomyces sp. BC1034]